jgi:quercetin dioxygenase-like cupin family protein
VDLPKLVKVQTKGNTSMTKTGKSGAVLLRPESLPSYDRGGGKRTTPLVSPSLGATSFINGITTFDPGASIPFHSHNCEESVILLEGEAVMEIEGEEHILEVFDTTWIPANVPHRFRNPSPAKPMKILWTYASINATRTLTETGVTNSVSMEHLKSKS